MNQRILLAVVISVGTWACSSATADETIYSGEVYGGEVYAGECYGGDCYGGHCNCGHCKKARSQETLLGRIAQRRAQMYPWHGAYYESAWGTPVAVVMNPRVGRYTEYGWGVGGFRTQRANHQFGRTYPGGPGEGGFLPTPRWPSDTTQFGSYYVRGPW